MNNLIYSRQSGFRNYYGTEPALIKIVDELLLNLDNNRVSGVLLLDYCKAFDMIDHNLLLRKLEAHRVKDRAYDWCQSYLSGRRQLVCIDGKNSSLACVNHGVPQDTILGPLFFILFINDLPLYITAQIDLYADDTTITCSADYKSMHKLEHDLNNSVAEILIWAVSNKLPINVDKTDVMVVTGKRLQSKLDFQPSVKFRDHELVSNVSSATLLGLDIDSRLLSFSQHVDKICKKLSQRIALFRKIRVDLPLGKDCYIIDLFHDGSPIKYSFVLMLIHLSSLATTSKFQKNICFKMRVVGLISINTKECKCGRHL